MHFLTIVLSSLSALALVLAQEFGLPQDQQNRYCASARTCVVSRDKWTGCVNSTAPFDFDFSQAQEKMRYCFCEVRISPRLAPYEQWFVDLLLCAQCVDAEVLKVAEPVMLLAARYCDSLMSLREFTKQAYSTGEKYKFPIAMPFAMLRDTPSLPFPPGFNSTA